MRHFPENTLSWSPRENASKATLYRNRHQTQRISPETNRSKPTLTSHFLLHAWLIHAVWAGLHASSSRFILNVHRVKVSLAPLRCQKQLKCRYLFLFLFFYLTFSSLANFNGWEFKIFIHIYDPSRLTRPTKILTFSHFTFSLVDVLLRLNQLFVTCKCHISV